MTKATEASEILRNEAEARAFDAGVNGIAAEAADNFASAELADAQTALLRIQRKRDMLKDDFDNSQDYRHGYVSFAHPITAESVEALTHTLRRMDRLFPSNPIVIELNTPGGEITAGFQLYDEILRLRGLGHKITIRVRGNAASMGAIVLQAADSREVGPNAWVMIHRAMFQTAGKSFEVQDELELVKRLEDKFADILSKRSGQPKEIFVKLFGERKDQWFSAEEAVALGLADVVA